MGVGVGAAASAALAPAIEPARQAAWASNRNAILDAATIARLQAQGGITLDAARTLNHRHGLQDSYTDALVYLAQTAPTIAEAITLYRRSKITVEQLQHALAKAQIDPQYWPALLHTTDERLSAQVVALAIVRGIMKDPGFLPVGPPSAEGKVKAFPVSPLDPLEEAAASGWDRERLFVETAIMGRPMGPEGAAAAFFRGILELADYQRAVAEGDVRNEWAEAILEAARQIPSVADYVNARIRGWITEEQMHAGAARHGMSPADTDLLYLRTGRPATVRQVLVAERRGGARNGPLDGIPPDQIAAVAQSDIRPEWTQVEHLAALTYPSGFMISGTVQAGDLTAAEAHDLLYEMGWPEKWIDVFVASWAPKAGGQAGKAETASNLRAEYEGYLLTEQELRTALQALGYAPAEVDREVHLGDAARVKAYRDKALEATHKSYIAAQLTSADVATYLGQLHIDAAAIPELVAIWDIEKAVTRKTLTAAQIKAAYRRGTITQAEAISDLEEHGYNATDALVYLTS